MREKSPDHGRVLVVDDVVFLTGFADNPADLRVMNMAYPGEKMMFYLEIQPAQEPEE